MPGRHTRWVVITCDITRNEKLGMRQFLFGTIRGELDDNQD
ncbi:hypothetical protein S1OALGB6SA_1288 [Olavius algarvensis spirochete endosymbiont]|nr:hypothetical protein S1OALGB6SA_1288 [Olavius algarvensis spirochete endosymbiont]